jgi:hypothetical protein
VCRRVWVETNRPRSAVLRCRYFVYRIARAVPFTIVPERHIGDAVCMCLGDTGLAMSEGGDVARQWCEWSSRTPLLCAEYGFCLCAEVGDGVGEFKRGASLGERRELLFAECVEEGGVGLGASFEEMVAK